MKVEITKSPGIFAEGMLKGIIEERGASYPHIVIEMSVIGVNDPVHVTLHENDLCHDRAARQSFDGAKNSRCRSVKPPLSSRLPKHHEKCERPETGEAE